MLLFALLLDIKTWDPQRHRHLTGKDVGPTIDFARRLAARKRPCWLRFVLVPGFTDDPQDISQIAKFAARLGNIELISWANSNGKNWVLITLWKIQRPPLRWRCNRPRQV